jgi:Na+/proline symporter
MTFTILFINFAISNLSIIMIAVMAVTSSLSAEMVAVSSVVTYDIYQVF